MGEAGLVQGLYPRNAVAAMPNTLSLITCFPLNRTYDWYKFGVLKDNNMSPLGKDCCLAFRQSTKALLKGRIKINYSNHEENRDPTLLSTACTEHRLAVLELLHRGADG